MTTTATELPALALKPSEDRRPVELALTRSIADNHSPETFLWISIHRPDGGVNVRYAWTDGGTDLGDRIDLLALAAPLDAADWLEITGRHVQVSHRGRIEILAHPLRPILANVQAGVRAPEDRRAGVQRVLDKAAELCGQPHLHSTAIPRWLGVGPDLINRRT
ncbi:hypothetical protein [Streptomyces liangshanensis]|uniref:hypothetical protein n=1 Tax=Streptomyces liangshanensis TaxID=2717324 RepID=UPI0036DE0466